MLPENIEALGCYQSNTFGQHKRDCPHYRSNTKVRYAKGFIGILDCIPHKQMQTVVAHLMGYLSRRTYYRTRKGRTFTLPRRTTTYLEHS
ncbi:MAG: DUF6078 family protein [Bacteroides thetaiotaomicron]